MVLKTVHDDYVAVVLGQLSLVKRINPKIVPTPGLREHIESIQTYEKELRDLESYLKRLLEVPLEEKE
jgi:hypothetical protein